MKFKEALWNNLLDNGESFRKKDGNQPTDDSTITKINGVYVWSSNRNEEVELSDITLNMVGEIISADPEVLTVKELVNEKHKLFGEEWIKANVFDFADMCAKEADKNGQIKEWKRLKPLIDEVKEIMLNYPSEFTEDSHKAIQNLTPPWEPEK